jgi:hypothetical protein
MKQLSAIISALSILVLAPVPMFAQQIGPQSRACKPWKQDPDKELRRGQPGVLLSAGIFDYSSRQYPFEALSIWGKHPIDADKICIRYSVANMDSKKIEALVWPDAGMYFLDVAPKLDSGSINWVEWMRQPSPPYPALPAQSEIKAFQNSSAAVRALLPSAPKHASTTKFKNYTSNLETSLGYAIFNISDRMSEAIPALAAVGIGANNVTALGVGVSINKRLNVATEFSGADFSFVHFSSVIPEGKSYVFEEGVKFVDFKSGAQVYAPFSQALYSLKEGVSSRDVIDLAAYIAKSRNVPLKLSGPLFFRKVTAPIAQSAKIPSLFLVEHPVTVRFGDNVMCMSVASYSPVPVQLGENYCEHRIQR